MSRAGDYNYLRLAQGRRRRPEPPWRPPWRPTFGILRCAAPTPFTTALVRAFAFAMARSRAIPIVSPSTLRKTPFAGVRDGRVLNTLEANEQTRLKDYFRHGFQTRLKRCGARVGLPASLPPFTHPAALQSPHMYALDSRRHSTASSPRRGDFVFARFFQAQDGSTRYETTDFVPTGATPANSLKKPSSPAPQSL